MTIAMAEKKADKKVQKVEKGAPANVPERVAQKLPERAAPHRDLQASIHEEIARTYLKLSEKPVETRRRASPIPWLIALAAVIIAVAVLATKSKFDVKIRMLGEIPSVSLEGGRIQFDNLKDKGVYLLKGTRTNSELVRRTSFMGDAEIGGRTTDECVVLSNSKGSGWANYAIELKEPLDLTKLDLKFTGRGNAGGEIVGMVIMDYDRRSYRMDRDAAIQLTRDWQLYRVSFASVKKAVDLTNVTAIKFEFGTLTAGNSAGATMFLKDIYVAKTRKALWR